MRKVRQSIAIAGGPIAAALATGVARAQHPFDEAFEDAQALDLDALINRLAQYQRGEQLAPEQVALGSGLMASIPSDLPNGWRQLWRPDRETDPKLLPVGELQSSQKLAPKVSFPAVPAPD